MLTHFSRGVVFRQGFTVGVFSLFIKVTQVHTRMIVSHAWQLSLTFVIPVHTMGVLFAPLGTLGYNNILLLGFVSISPSMFS